MPSSKVHMFLPSSLREGNKNKITAYLNKLYHLSLIIWTCGSYCQNCFACISICSCIICIFWRGEEGGKKKPCHSHRKLVHEIQLFWRGEASSATKNFIADPKLYSCSRKGGKNIFHRKPSLVDLLCLIKKANALG